MKENTQEEDLQQLAKFLKKHGYEFEIDYSPKGFIYVTVDLPPDIADAEDE